MSFLISYTNIKLPSQSPVGQNTGAITMVFLLWNRINWQDLIFYAHDQVFVSIGFSDTVFTTNFVVGIILINNFF